MTEEKPPPAEVVSLADIRTDRIFANTTPEQWLKWAVISNLVPPAYIVGAINDGCTVDEMFHNLATWMYPDSEA